MKGKKIGYTFNYDYKKNLKKKVGNKKILEKIDIQFSKPFVKKTILRKKESNEEIKNIKNSKGPNSYRK